MKKEFFEYIGPSDSLHTYVRSYKLILFKCFFELMDDTGCAFTYDVSKRFKEFYIKRVELGKIPDTQVESRIENITRSSVQDVYSVILSNPFKHINENGFLLKRTTAAGKEQFYLPPQLVQELTSDDLQKVKEILEDKIKLYYSRIDGEEKMREFVEKFTTEYVPAKRKPFAGHPVESYIRKKVPQLIYDTGLVDEQNYLITGSAGKGNWATVPWVCIFDRKITTSATKGVYIVYLLSKDGNTLYLSLNQGCTEITQQHNKRETIEIMRAKAEEIIAEVDDRGFLSDQNVSLGEGLTQLAEFYEKGIIFYKAYHKGSIPNEEELQNDLKNMMDIYKEYASNESSKSRWWPSKEEYDPGISKEKWIELLNDPTIFTESALNMIAEFYTFGGVATCTQLADYYKKTYNYYLMTSVHLAERIVKQTRCLVIEEEKNAQNVKWWPVLYVGKEAGKGDKGSFIWKIRDELYEALQEYGIERFVSESRKGGEIEMTIKEKVTAIKNYIATKGFNYEGNLIENFYLSLKSKPFVILAGTSGTGKTKLVQLFAEAIGAKNRVKIVPVRPDWSDSTELLGYVDLQGNFKPGAIIDFLREANENISEPYFICLDEMNLARVEYYLSDFLSIIETREFRENGRLETSPLVSENYCRCSNGKNEYGELCIPENLYFIGTVNMDETTFPFSKKVLDRANTIEFSYVDLIPKNRDISSYESIVSVDNKFLKTEYLYLKDCADTEFIDEICLELEQFNKILAKSNLHVGYRVRDEVSFYMINNKECDLLSQEEAFDNCIMQKILPRIQGSSAAIKDTLCELFIKCAGDYNGFSGNSVFEQMESYITEKECKYRNSANKIAFMLRRYEEDGFTSYWL